MSNPKTNDPLTRAVRAYRREVREAGDMPSDDSQLMEIEGQQYAVLVSGARVLAVYAVHDNGHLEQLEVTNYPIEQLDEEAER
jgi:hypothetical protein